MARSAASVRRAIDTLKLDDVLSRVVEERHWTEGQAKEALIWYRNFLWLAYKHRNSRLLAINEDSDHLWHAHITFTKRYSSDCDRIFGRFLDHTPTRGGLRGLTGQNRKLYDLALRWYEEEFDSTPPKPSPQCYTASGSR
jgi:hypothetical protein